MLDRDCIKHLVAYAGGCSGDGLLSGLLLDEDGETIRCAGGVYSLEPVYQRTYFSGRGKMIAGN